ncbi:hypothetical protein MNBD_GAMMA24-2072 [hydrothermal vent metagenome]|uniref:Uncharacterized protein n=1 Tax=hydrothermal vent metagenome TaxID=652676 RepID=A0A3B1C3T0_9ZZZZ
MKNKFLNFVCIILLAILLAGCDGENARKTKYYEKGKTYYEQGNYEKAKVELKNVLQIDPKFADAHYLFGEVEEKNKNLRAAYIHYRAAAELDDSNLDAHNKLARIYLLSGDLDKAQEQLDKIVAQDPKNAYIKMLKLLIVTRKGETDKAIAMAKNIVSENKNKTDAIFLLSNLYLRKKEIESAVKALVDGIKNNPDVIPLRLQLGGIYAMQKNYAAAEKMLKEIIALQPDELGYRQRLAKFYVNNTKEYNKAETVLRDAVELDTKDESRELILVEFLAKYKSIKEAETELLAAIDNHPDAFALRFALAKLYEKVKPEKVEATYKEIIDLKGTDPEGLKAKDLLAQVFLQQKKFKQASAYVDEVLDENPGDIHALLVKGKLALVNNDPVSAIADFRSIIKNRPEMVEASQLLAVAHVANNEPELAKEALIRGIEAAKSNPKAHLNYASYLIAQKNYKDANIEIDKALKVSPASLDVLKMKLNIGSLLTDKKMVSSTIDLIKKYYPDNAIGYEKSGDFNRAFKKYDKAILDYEKAIKLSGKMLPALASIIKINLSTKNYAEAIDRLNEISAKQPKNPIPLELLGEVYFAKNDFIKAKKYITEAINLSPKWSVPYGSLASIYLSRKDIPSAIKVYKSALLMIPNDPGIYTKLAQIYERTGKYDNAIRMYEKVLKINPGDALASNNLASILSDVRSDAESLQRAKKLALKFEKSSQPGFLDTLGWIYYKSADYPKSIEILSKVVDKQPKIALFQYHLGMAYYKSGDKENAKIYLQKSLASKQKFKGKNEIENILTKI